MVKLSAPVATLGVVVFGTAASLLAKLIYSVHAVDLAGNTVPFTKPWFQVLAMFAGMSVCILLDLPKPKSTSAERSPLLSNGNGSASSAATATPDKPPPQSVWIINFPTLFDLFATACGTTGLMYTTVSVYQMLRGAQLVFTALLSIVFLKRTLSAQKVLAIAVCMVGIIMVGLANVLGEGDPVGKSDTAFGILVILAGQILQASQVVLEEHLLQNLAMSSVRVVAYEGMFGMVHCLFWVFPVIFFLPGRDGGHLENPVDALYMATHSWAVAGVVILDMALMLAYNVCGMEVTNHLSSVSRVIIETLRTLFVWLIDLVLFYFISGGRVGEEWTPYSYLQALGFSLTVLGTVLYNYEQLAADMARRRRKATAAEVSITPYSVIPSSTVASTAAALASVASSPLKQKSDLAVCYAEDGMGLGSGIVKSESRPVGIATGGIGDYEEDEEEEEEEEERVGSFYGNAVGSASHGSYLASTPLSSSLRQRSNHS
jgi:drug/metabolite transporter (DMT)-like permease